MVPVETQVPCASPTLLNFSMEREYKMKYSLKLAACLLATLCTVMANAQLPSAELGGASQPSTGPSAYLYVTSNPSGSTYEINGYSVASDGTLSTIAGSPFDKVSKPLYATANTTHFLFDSDGTNIYSFSIASNGALKQVSSVNAAQHYDFGGGLTGLSLVLDHTGSTLYALASDGIGDNEFQFFSKNSATGALTYTGSTVTNAAYGELAFIANNKYAYGFTCFEASTYVYGLSRGSDGSLTPLNLNVPIPTYPNGEYCPVAAAADPFGNLAVALDLETTGPPSPPAWLAVYTADSSGNLTTNSTYQNMLTSEVGNVNAMSASPAGNLLAVAGDAGLQVFFLNGSKQIAAYTGFLAEHNISQVFWDNHNHLYGISSASGRLYVFTVTTTGYKQAPGSPHLLTNPRALSVLSK
jgi:hypothetical protein